MSGAGKSSWKPRVVIIDDSRTVQAMLEQIFLNRLSCDVVGMAHSADEALPLIEALRPDIVTIDLRMPGRDGFSLLDDLRDEHHVQKIVVASEIASDIQLRAKVSDLGADAAFDKRVFTGRPGFFCVKMREIIQSLKNGLIHHASGKAEAGLAHVCCEADYPVPPEEGERLRLIAQLGINNAARDPVFDLITQHVGVGSDFPVCLLTVIDKDVQWVKSAYGFKVEQTARAEALCSHTICAEELFAVPNTLTDDRFAHNPLVTGMPGIRSYFGYPIAAPNGVRLGALCLIDLKPRKITQAVADNLQGMAAIVSSLIAERAGSGSGRIAA